MNIKQYWNIRHSGKAALGVAVLAALGMSTQTQAQSGLSIDSGEITYADHVAQIITDNCVVCHREGGVGPMQLTNFEQVRPWAPLIGMRVANKEMPPYSYDDHIGIQDLQGDWRLSDEEINTVTQWVAQGAPEGDWGDRSHPVANLPASDE